jgi:Rrf2 family protein
MFGKTTEYAIRALVYIFLQNKDGKRPGFKEIAREIDSPEQFTAKILQLLAREKLISSMKGRGGGFFFKDISIPLNLHEVVRVVEGEEFFTRCGFGLNHCDQGNPCPLHDEYSRLREGYYKMLTGQTIQSLADKLTGKKAVLTRESKKSNIER